MTPSTNVYKVPLKQRRRWSPRAKHTFNATYDFLYNNQTSASHPKAIAQSPAHWKTLSWNAAWTAADAVDAVDELLPVIDEILDINQRTGAVVRRHAVVTTQPKKARLPRSAGRKAA